MRGRRFGRRHAPPWWPETEPWPPPGRHWVRGRRRFVRRIAVVFAAVLFLSALGISTLISMVLGMRHPGGLPFHMPALPVLAVGWFVLLAILTIGMRRVGRPLGDVVEAAGRVAEGDYSARVPEHGPPSLNSVGRAFNSMAARLEVHDRQRRELMADIAHELRTPLSVIQARLEGLLDGVYPRDEAQIGQVVADIKVLARRGDPILRPVPSA